MSEKGLALPCRSGKGGGLWQTCGRENTLVQVRDVAEDRVESGVEPREKLVMSLFEVIVQVLQVWRGVNAVIKQLRTPKKAQKDEKEDRAKRVV